MIDYFDTPHQFEPLMPSEAKMEPLLARAHDLTVAATGLAGLPIAQDLRSLLRAMNSYYTNRIEGQHTRPAELEQALRQNFSKDEKLAARQRLAIARAMYKDAPFLILDEATSALDNESERMVQDALQRLQVGRTTLVIAHRLSTIENADRIVVMESGKIIETGNHTSLIQHNGVYASMFRLGNSGYLIDR